MIFKMYNCDFGINFDGVTYDFEHVDSVTIEDPEMNKLIRGSNQKNKVGLAYKEGTKEPKKMTVVLIGVTAAMHGLLTEIFLDQSRCECFCIDRLDGSSKIAKNAVLSQRPMQLTLDSGPESMNMSLVFETFDLEETHKA